MKQIQLALRFVPPLFNVLFQALDILHYVDIVQLLSLGFGGASPTPNSLFEIDFGNEESQFIFSDIVKYMTICFVTPAEVEEISPLAERRCLIRIFQIDGWSASEVDQPIVDTQFGCNSSGVLLRWLPRVSLILAETQIALMRIWLPGYLFTEDEAA